MRDPQPGAAGRYGRFLILLLGCTAGLVLAGWWPTQRLGGNAAVRGLLVACLVSLAGSIVGSLPLIGLAEGGASPTRFLASLGLRFAVVAGGAAGVAFAGWVAPRPFLIWVGLSYLVLLAVDVRFALARQAGPPGS